MPQSRSIGLNPETRGIVDAARKVWIRRLIDPSRTNSLLYYRELKVGTLDLTAATDAVERLLAGGKLAVESLVPAGGLAEFRDPVARARAEAEACQKVRHALVALQRKALSNIEEKGIETLHLAIGMATWPAADGGRPYDAPVLLLPARIEARGRAGDALRLALGGDPQLNPVLVHVLEANYAIHVDVPALLGECSTEDEAGQWRIDPEGVFARVERAAKTVRQFEVTRRAILANFQFAKMAMVEDLKRNGDTIASSDIVAAVAGHADSRQRLAQAVVDIEPAQLDERPASDDYLVLDADSTQHRAIVLVSQGQNGIVQGPPGTGKSQTISNLIAQSVAEGRRVLFVAEKRAALDAVIKRLNAPDVGLGHLVLDLHGAAVSRKDVMERLARALQQIRNAVPADGAAAIHREFEARRRELNEHARRVNERRQPTGLSVNRMLGKLLQLPAAARSKLRLRGEVLGALTGARADEVRQCLLEGAANPTLLLGTDRSPWNNADITDGRRAQEARDLAARAAYELWPQFERLLERAVHRLGVRPPESLDESAALLALLRDLRRVRERYPAEIFAARPGELARALGPATGGRLTRAWAFASNAAYRAARKQLIGLRAGPAAAAALREEALAAQDVLDRWRALGAQSEPPREIGDEAPLADALSALSDATQALGAIVAWGPFGAMPFIETAARLSALAGDERTPYRLPSVHAVRARLREAGLAGLLEDLREQEVTPAHWAERFEYVWLYSALEDALASDGRLAAFSGRTHENVVRKFVELDRERIRLAAARVRRLHAERAIEAMNRHFDQANLVRAEANKKSRHIPVRELLARAPDVLTRIAPCWVASPLSVSQLLDGDRRHFDIVVFDEASQILQEEAIPALYRAKQVVVAGDRHQLPPTTFFATAVDGEDVLGAEDGDARDAMATASGAVGGFESLLDTLDAFLPSWLLEWHYRSDDERLIAFSNAHIYEGRLVTFPSAHGQEAVRHVLVAHDPSLGAQEESASREVEEVVRQVLLHAQTRPHETLGVITMGIKHANRIQAELDRALDARTGLEDFFAWDRDERFFVKNLETVQGDERDAIILSVGYGKAANGDLPHRFGPLTQDVGYRRLNVAVTRARRRMCVVSSFAYDEIDINRSGSRGVGLLKAYLEYAARGGAWLPEEARAGETALNAFEADVRDALEMRGMRTRPQFGASRLRIDLVAMHPQKAGRPVLAIECDGASYHSGATARDRDRLRQAHLERLGWQFHRVWSTDWFHSREQETERVLAAYEDAVRAADLQDAAVAGPSADPDGARLAPAAPQQPIARRCGPRPRVPNRATIAEYRERELRQLVEWIQSDGLLRTDEELIRDVFEELPFERLGSQIRDRLHDAVRSTRRR